MIHVAVVGTGNIAWAHIPALLTFPERCKIVALCDIYPEKAQAFKDKYNLDCEIFDDHEKMLASAVKIDLVHVCTPPYVHAEIAINAMNAGKHVCVEKPMATCLSECDAMLEAEKKNNVTLCCIAQNRFQDAISKLKGMLDSGLAGKPRFVGVNSLWWRGHSYYDLWWRGLWEKEGGGPTLNHAVHHIDMLNWMQGQLPIEVNAMLANVMHDNSEVEDLSLAMLKYSDGSIAQVTSSVVHHGEEQGLVFQCEHAKLQAPWSCYASTSQPNGFPIHNEELEKKLNETYSALPSNQHSGHTGQIDDLLTALENGIRPMITGMDGRKTVELITAIYKSGIEKSLVTLPIEKEDAYYHFEAILENAPRFYKKGTSIENINGTITVGNYEKKEK